MRIFGVLGHPISHSLSPVMQTAAMQALKLDGIYASLDVPPRLLEPAVAGLIAAGVDGLNVTIPHKTRILRCLAPQEIDATAARLGAVNTLVRRGRRLIGYNTDAEGFRQTLQRELHMTGAGARVLLIGAGGAARAVAWVLQEAGAEALWILNRTRSRAEQLARWLRPHAGRTAVRVVSGRAEAARAAAGADLVVNATSLGLRAGNPLPLDPAALRRGSRVCDLVYRAPTTAFAQAARRRGALAVDGIAMLVYQGAESFRLWWDRPAPVDVMRRAVEEAVRQRRA